MSPRSSQSPPRPAANKVPSKTRMNFDDINESQLQALADCAKDDQVFINRLQDLTSESVPSLHDDEIVTPYQPSNPSHIYTSETAAKTDPGINTVGSPTRPSSTITSPSPTAPEYNDQRLSKQVKREKRQQRQADNKASKKERKAIAKAEQKAKEAAEEAIFQQQMADLRSESCEAASNKIEWTARGHSIYGDSTAAASVDVQPQTSSALNTFDYSDYPVDPILLLPCTNDGPSAELLAAFAEPVKYDENGCIDFGLVNLDRDEDFLALVEGWLEESPEPAAIPLPPPTADELSLAAGTLSWSSLPPPSSLPSETRTKHDRARLSALRKQATSPPALYCIAEITGKHARSSSTEHIGDEKRRGVHAAGTLPKACHQSEWDWDSDVCRPGAWRRWNEHPFDVCAFLRERRRFLASVRNMPQPRWKRDRSGRLRAVWRVSKPFKNNFYDGPEDPMDLDPSWYQRSCVGDREAVGFWDFENAVDDKDDYDERATRGYDF